jgi:predicted RNase H-like nuclease (RuvC/YqgF family)
VIASLEDGLKQAQERIEAEQRCSADMNQWLARERDLAASYRNSVENYCQTICDLERQHSDALAESDELRRRLEEIRTLSYLERA